MKVREFGANLIQLIRFEAVFPINCYLVREEDGFTLIDTGMSGTARAILESAKPFNLPIVRILLTHAHGDHVGSMDALHQALPDAEVLISARDSRFLTGDRTLDPGEAQTPPKGQFINCSTRPNRLLVPGDRIGSLEAIASPGHTPGHLAFLDIRDRSLIAGDAFQTRGGVAVSGTMEWAFPFPAIATWHRPAALDSARNLRALEPSRLAIGHGRMLENPLPEMDRAIEIADRQIKQQQAKEPEAAARSR